MTTAVGLGVVTWRLHGQARAEAIAEEAARNAETSRDEVVRHVLHDLRSPLTVIIGYASMLARRVVGEDASMAGGINEAAGRMDAMLREISTAQGGTLPLYPSPVRLQRFLEGVVEAHRSVDALHQYEVVFDGPPEFEGHWDASLLGRVLDNLLSNARKFSPPESRIRVRARVYVSDAVIAVSDEGRGIPKEELQRVFEPFHRAENATGTEGLGIGLASARNILRQHGGRIRVQSALNRGTTITIRLPITGPPRESSPAEEGKPELHDEGEKRR